MSDVHHPIDMLFREFEWSTKAHAGHALLAAAFLDQELEAAILTKMRPLSKKKHDRLFVGFGPLSELAAKIELAYALSLLTDEIYTNMRAIKKVRDTFAHASKTMTFFSAEVVDDLKAFTGWGKEKITNPDLFYKQVNECLSHLTSQTGPPAS